MYSSGLYQRQDALNDEDGCRLDVLDFIAAVVVAVIVNRAVDGIACLQFLEMLNEKIVVKSIRMVVVQLAAFLKGQLVVALVVAVVRDETHLVLAKTILQPESQRGFSAARAACNADDEIVHNFKFLPNAIDVENPVPMRYTCLVDIIPHFSSF